MGLHGTVPIEMILTSDIDATSTRLKLVEMNK